MKKIIKLIFIVHLSNAKFMGHFDVKVRDELENPFYAGGMIHATSCQDTLLCQMYFNPFISSVLDHIIKGRVFMMSIREHFKQFEVSSYLCCYSYQFLIFLL